jgi:HSP20 family protein
MSLVRYEANPIAALFDEMESLWSNPFDLTGRTLEGRMFPNVDIVEQENGYAIKADLPGLSKDEIKVNIEDGVLTVSGEKKSEFEKKEKDSYYHLERSYGKFARSFSLPTHVDNKNIEAHYTNGVLEIHLRKTEEAKPKAIEVKVD